MYCQLTRLASLRRSFARRSRVSTSDYLVWLTLLLRPKIKEKSSSYASILLPQSPKLPFQFSNLLFQRIFTFAFKNGFVSGGIVGYSDAADLDNFEYIVSPANKVRISWISEATWSGVCG